MLVCLKTHLITGAKTLLGMACTVGVLITLCSRQSTKAQPRAENYEPESYNAVLSHCQQPKTNQQSCSQYEFRGNVQCVIRGKSINKNRRFNLQCGGKKQQIIYVSLLLLRQPDMKSDQRHIIKLIFKVRVILKHVN